MTAWRCSRSARTRARRSWRSSPRSCPAGRARSSSTWPGCRASPGSPGHRPPEAPEPAVRHHQDVPRIKTPEPILPIQLIALDIDGTLVGDDLEIGPDTRAAVRAARARGVIVSLVTGRMVSSAMHFARVLELDSPVVGYQGALVREMPAAGSDRLGRLLVHTPMPAAVAREIVDLDARTRARPAPQPPRAPDRADRRPASRRVRRVHRRRPGAVRRPRRVDPPSDHQDPRGRRPAAAERAGATGPGAVRGGGRGDHQPSAIPGVHGTRRVEGPRDPLARAPDADPARSGAGHRRPVERFRDARRGRPRGGDADGAGRGAGGGTLRRSAAGRGRRRPDDRGAGPGAAGRGSGCRRPAGRGGSGGAGAPTPASRQCPSRHERRASSPTTSTGAGRGDRGPAARRRRRAADRHGLRDRRRPRRRRRHRAAVPGRSGGRPTAGSCCCSMPRRRRGRSA